MRPSFTVPSDTPSRLILFGALILPVALTLHWYDASLAGIDVSGKRTGWEALGVLDLYLVLLAVVAALVATRGAVRAEPTRNGLTGAAFVALVAVAYRVLSPPGGALPGFVTEPSVGPGAFVAGFGLMVLLFGVRSPSSS